MTKKSVSFRGPSNFSLRKKLDEAWRLKIHFSYEKAFEILWEIKSKLGIPPGLLSSEQVKSLFLEEVFSLPFLAELLSLDAALLRVSGGKTQSRDLMKSVEEQIRTLRIPVQGYYCYEKGLAHFQSGDFYSAMDYFSSWRETTKDPFQLLCATGNLVFCLESLGLDYSGLLKETEGLLKKQISKPYISKVQSQLSGLSAREFWRQGNIKKALLVDNYSTLDFDQLYYFKAWLQGLPYHTSYDSNLEIQSTNIAVKSGNSLDNRSFRLRTLKGDLHPDDKHYAKPSDLIDRFYLYVWRWLAESSGTSDLKIKETISILPSLEELHRLTAEDKRLFRNSLAWIALFDNHGEQVRSVYRELFSLPYSASYQLLDFEYNLVEYFRLKNQGFEYADTVLSSLKANPLWKSSEIELSILVEGKGKLVGLDEKLRSFIKNSGDGKTVVDCEASSLITERESIHSDTLTRAAAFLFEKTSVSCEDFSREVLDLYRYDASIHQLRISGIVSRLRTVFSNDLKFLIRNGRIYVEGSWTNTHIQKKFFKVGFLFPLVTSSSLETKLPKWQGALKREQVEQVLKKPRSTTNRLLALWVNQGELRRNGTGRNVTYSWNKNLEKVSYQNVH